MKRCIALVLAAAMVLLCGCGAELPAATPAAEETAAPTPELTAGPTPEPTPTPEPEPQVFTLSFAGDCTLGDEHGRMGGGGGFIATVGEDYSHPFSGVRDIFAADDMTLVNLEGAFTAYNVAEKKQFRFRAPAAYADCLTAGSVECVNLANNHTGDYGITGYHDTKDALEMRGIAYVENEGTLLYTTPSGLNVGIYTCWGWEGSDMAGAIEGLRAQGAEVVIASFHWGKEGHYLPNEQQKTIAHRAVAAGADIVYGHHPHVLQPAEYYEGGVILYSMGNFSFGGNRNPSDKDTAIVQQQVIRHPDGRVELGETVFIPCSLTSTPGRNDYRPLPYAEGTAEYERVMQKLNGTYR